MEICNCNHPEIVYNERECPLCKIRGLSGEALDCCNNVKDDTNGDDEFVRQNLIRAIVNLEMALE